MGEIRRPLRTGFWNKRVMPGNWYQARQSCSIVLSGGGTDRWPGYSCAGRRGKPSMVRSMRDLPPIHPGEQLREEFMKPFGLTAYRLAKDIGVPVTRVQAIIAERRGISADTALRLARYFTTTPEFWLNLQRDYELETAAEALGPRLDTKSSRARREPPRRHAGA